jgi:NADPH:quinone reductase-like Zn-dependent oxidoreductase
MPYQRVVVTEFGGPEKLKVVTESNLPEPAAGQIRVKVLTAGTGFTDTIIRVGQYIDVKDKPPFTLGYDWVGVVDKLGAGVSNLKVGQWVADMPVIGGYTQYLCVDATQVVPIPDTVDPAEAVCMILSYTTAYQMLTRVRDIPKGSVCLVHAAGGAVGTALLELGRLMGLKMFGTASKSKHELVTRLGGIPIDYRNEDFVARIKQETDGQGVDVVFDTIGGKNWARSYQCVKRGGILIAFGALQFTTGEESVLSATLGFAKLLGFWKLIPDGKATTFYNIHHRRQKLPAEFAQDVQALMKLLVDGKLKPAVAGRYPLADAANVHRMIDKAEIAGKVVLICNSTDN